MDVSDWGVGARNPWILWISMGYVYPGRGKCLSYKGSLRGGAPHKSQVGEGLGGKGGGPSLPS